nr:hypothetical protein [Raoultella ornithinolytica]
MQLLTVLRRNKLIKCRINLTGQGGDVSLARYTRAVRWQTYRILAMDFTSSPA